LVPIYKLVSYFTYVSAISVIRGLAINIRPRSVMAYK